MKLKLMSFLKSEPDNGSAAGVADLNDQENIESAVDADAVDADAVDADAVDADDVDSVDGDAVDGDADAVDGDAVDGDADAVDGDAVDHDSALGVVSLSSVVAHVNSMSSHVAALTEQNEALAVQVASLTGDHSAEIASQASARAQAITASQGVPVASVGEVTDEASASNAPKNSDEFLAAYSEIKDPMKAGAYFSKYGAAFKK